MERMNDVRNGRRGAARDMALLSLALVVIAAAGAYFWYSSGGERPPTDPSSYNYFRCQACKNEFHLNGQEMEQALRRREFTQAADGRTLAFKCPKCGKNEATVREDTPTPAAAP